MKHRAPIIGIAIVNSNGVPLESQNIRGPAPHRVLIASEERFKVFSLPQLKPVNKYKLTAHEGARMRHIAFATFMCTIPVTQAHGSPAKTAPKVTSAPTSPAAPSAPGGGTDQTATGGDTPLNNEPTVNSAGPEITTHCEISLLCLTNLGDCLVLTVPELRRQLHSAAVRRKEINGISSLCFTSHGEALYMMSSSEVQRISLSATKIVTPTGMIDVEDWSAPVGGDLDQEEEEEDDRDDANRPCIILTGRLSVLSTHTSQSSSTAKNS
ncbi:lethal(2) giant larvae protein-like [Anopheles aquasalis]|uniref:lethal(2) giant larvae protein-like n=1 Tax=Anopheles aquasalis TaxID=42839 RepID=UPI00215AE43B|nr:lethal(2) giant larvae protein-like [Anopheles aquasalis]